jgi:predicted AAA+ superfamily ATPase
MNYLNLEILDLDFKDHMILDELINYLIDNPSCFIDINKILRQHSLSQKKVNSLFQLLEKHNIGKRVFMLKIPGLELISHFKFLFFNFTIFDQRKNQYRPDQEGALLEQYFFTKTYQSNEIFLFRTIDGMEIDFILKNNDELICIEIKKDQFIYAGDFKSLHFFDQKFPQIKKQLYVLHNGTRDQNEGKVQVIPLAKYLNS